MFRSFLFTLVLAIVFFTAEQYRHPAWLHPQWKAMLLFFLSVSFLLHRLMNIGFENNREKFVQMYMASLVARLLLSLVFVGYFLYRKVELKQIFIVNFLVLYLCYTGFEIYTLSRNLRRDL
ncbi:hypothetical protein [Tellurirhabdus rosea]|uniref:hypothetical protein n=1 Tax=Tellurirhabdus rosea TaxID=2674997 RepID=UPI0022591ED0|nr:hypothetical protein [Tellurirhabdus rosea]